jgi:hypothetical protein
MPNRRVFIGHTVGAAAGLFLSRALADAWAQVGATPGKRREVSIAGRRV